MTLRRAAVAGAFYPAESEQLLADITRLCDAAARSPAVSHWPHAYSLKALVLPHAGYQYSGAIAAVGYRLLLQQVVLQQVAAQSTPIRRILLLGPNHRVALTGIATPGVSEFQTPLGKIALDQPTLAQLEQLPFVKPSPLAHQFEHCLEVQLPFLQAILPKFTLVPLVVGQCTPQQVASVIAELLKDPGTFLIVSSDLSHFHSYALAQACDADTSQKIQQLHYDLQPEQACGAFSLNGLLLHAATQQWRCSILDVRNSGDTAGTRDSVVGYGAYAFYTEVQHE